MDTKQLLNHLITDAEIRQNFLNNRESFLQDQGIDKSSAQYSSMMKLNVTALLIDSTQAFSNSIKPI